MEREPFNQPNDTEEESSFEDDFDEEQIVEKTSFDQLEEESLFADKLQEEEVEEKTSAELVSKTLNPKIGQQIKNWGIQFGKDFLKGYDRLTKTAIWGGEEIKTKKELLSVPADSTGSAFRPDSKAYDYLTWLEYKKQSPEKTAAMEKVAENAAKEYTKTHTEGLKAVEEYDKKMAEMSNKVLTETDIIQVEKGYQITYGGVPVISLKRDYIDSKIEEFSLETDPIKQKELLNELVTNLSKRTLAKNKIPRVDSYYEEGRWGEKVWFDSEIKIREGLEKKLSDFLEEAINQREVDKKENEVRIEDEREAAEVETEKIIAKFEAETEKRRLVEEKKKSSEKISEDRKKRADIEDEEQKLEAEKQKSEENQKESEEQMSKDEERRKTEKADYIDELKKIEAKKKEAKKDTAEAKAGTEDDALNEERVEKTIETGEKENEPKKFPWEMTKREFNKDTMIMSIFSHEDSIKRALHKGRLVPDKVLKEYPDLAKSYWESIGIDPEKIAERLEKLSEMD